MQTRGMRKGGLLSLWGIGSVFRARTAQETTPATLAQISGQRYGIFNTDVTSPPKNPGKYDGCSVLGGARPIGSNRKIWSILQGAGFGVWVSGVWV